MACKHFSVRLIMTSLCRAVSVVAKYGDKSVYFDLEDLGNTTGQWDLYGSNAPSPYNSLQLWRQRAIEKGHEDDVSALVNMSVMWFVPRHVLLGVAEAAYSVGQIEEFYSLLPKPMSNIASAMATTGSALACLAASVLVSGGLAFINQRWNELAFKQH